LIAALLAALPTGCMDTAAKFGPAVANAPAQLSGKAAPKTSQDLLYVGGSNGSYTSILSYPGLQLIGKLHGHATGLCSDAMGNVSVTTSSVNPFRGEVLEYAHGATRPLVKLADGYRPVGCAVDPKTGDLAVADLGTLSGEETGIAIWRHAKGTPEFWSDPSFRFFLYCTYDDQGNLFADGVGKSSAFQLAEMPRNGTLEDVALNQAIEEPGNVQWDGTYVTVADDKAHVLYHFTITSYTGTLEGSTTLTGWHTTEPAQTWISGSTVVAPYGPGEAKKVGLWPYPGGGTPAQIAGSILRNGWLKTLTVSIAAPSKR
jgi:hypothetical protein